MTEGGDVTGKGRVEPRLHSIVDLFSRCALRGPPGPRRRREAPVFSPAALPCPVSASAWCPPSRKTINSLPPETLGTVFAALQGDVASLCACACVCRKWRDAVYTSSEAWSRIDVGEAKRGELRSRVASRLTDDRLRTLLARGGSQVTHILLNGSCKLTGGILQAVEQCNSLVVLDLTSCIQEQKLAQAQLSSLLHSLAGCPALTAVRLSGVRVDTGWQERAFQAFLAAELHAFLQDVPGADVDVDGVCPGRLLDEHCFRLIRLVDNGPSTHTSNATFVSRRCSECHVQSCNWCCSCSGHHWWQPLFDKSLAVEPSKVPVREAMTEQTCRCGAEFVCKQCSPRRKGPPCGRCRKYDCDLCDVTLTPGEQQALCSTLKWQGRSACARRMCRPCAQTLARPERCGACGSHYCEVCVRKYGEMTIGAVPGDAGEVHQGRVCMACAAQQQAPLRRQGDM